MKHGIFLNEEDSGSVADYSYNVLTYILYLELAHAIIYVYDSSGYRA